MSERERTSAFRDAESVFLAWRERREADGEGSGFEALCSEHPRLAEELRFLRSALAAERTTSLPPGSGFVEERLGLSADRGAASHGATAGEAAVPPGERIDPAGRYLDLGEVGRGGMSTVLRAWDRDLGRTVARKVASVPAGGEAGPETSSGPLARFLWEARVTARLDHPGIVPVHDVGVDRDGRAFFTMRLIKGRDFSEILELARRRREGWSLPRAVRTIATVCRTVAFAHAKGVVHRDLKPSNVMVGAFGETYVMDWGLARILGEEDRHAARLRFGADVPLTTVRTRRTGEPSDDPRDPLVTPAGTIVGTPVFMPPEQARGQLEEVGSTSDVYSLGAILYTLLAGRPPYVPESGRGSPIAILGKVVEGPPARVLDLDPAAPRDLVAICERAMARRREERFRSCQEMADALERAIEGTEAHGARGAGRRPRWGPFGRVAAILGLGAALGAAATVLLRSGADPGDDRSAILADLARIDALERESEDLWPATTSGAEAMRAWLARARTIAAGATRHRARSPETAADQARLVRRLEAFESRDGAGGPIARVERGLEFAVESRRKTIDDVWDLWQEAVAAIADPGRSPAYGGLALSPREGLIPIGPDPRSGLWELGHLPSGAVPSRGADGRLEIRPESGIVLVLVPGGPDGPPFLVSKAPLTRGQWLRIGGAPDAEGGGPSEPLTGVRWTEAVSLLRRVGLAPPTAAEWRRASSGGEALGLVGPPGAAPADFAAPDFSSRDLGLRPTAPIGGD